MMLTVAVVFLLFWFAFPAICIVAAAIYKTITKSDKGVIQLLDDM